jgi:hypothetical protein
LESSFTARPSVYRTMHHSAPASTSALFMAEAQLATNRVGIATARQKAMQIATDAGTFAHRTVSGSGNNVPIVSVAGNRTLGAENGQRRDSTQLSCQADF